MVATLLRLLSFFGSDPSTLDIDFRDPLLFIADARLDLLASIFDRSSVEAERRGLSAVSRTSSSSIVVSTGAAAPAEAKPLGWYLSSKIWEDSMPAMKKWSARGASASFRLLGAMTSAQLDWREWGGTSVGLPCSGKHRANYREDEWWGGSRA